MNKNLIIVLILFILVIVFLAINPFHFDWNGITAIATCVAVGGVGVAIWQIREMRKSTNAQIAMDLFNELRDNKTVEKLQAIYNDFRNDDSIRYILDRFEVLGLLVEKGIVDEDLAIHAYGGASALRCWYKLSQYIKQKSDDLGPWKINYEIYCRRCLEYFINHEIPVKIIERGVSTDIITKLLEPKNKPRTRKEIEKDLNNNKINIKS
jgi:hypothetical protein